MLLLLALAACTGPADPAKDGDPVDTGADTDPAVDTDGDDTGTGETAEPDPNTAPTAPGIAIVPAAPAPGLDFSVVVVTPSTDADGDAVSYTYAWTVDGVPATLDGATVPGTDTTLLQVWSVTVTPTDGTDAGPSATATATIGNSPPSAPVLSFNPVAPTDGDDIELVFDVPAIDPDGDPLTMSITWYDDGSLDTRLDDLTTIPGRYVGNDDTFLAVVSITDGYHDPVVTEASVHVAYSCANLPPFNLDDTTLTDARAYHGLTFDTTDGTLIGYDGRGSLVKSTYGGTYAVFVPGMGTIEQMDRLPDGDFVMADSTNQRLLRVTSAGGYETLASGVGSVYAVVVGPDGNVWITNGGVSRVDPATGVVTQIVASGFGATAHALNFNLDSTRLYIGTIGRGDVYYVDLDADLNPTTSVAVYASGVGAGYHDGMGVDECGNLYVADYSTRGLYRVELDGTVTSMVDTAPTSYGHGVMWGSGVGGWGDDTIYQPQPYNSYTVREVVIGLANGDTVRTWNGVPAPW